MEILKPEQMVKIEEFLKNQRDNSPLVIIGPNNFKRNDFLNKICTKFSKNLCISHILKFNYFR